MSVVPLIAFIGPSIARDEAARSCPGLDIRPPIRRGDLYRERERGAWGFLIIDGVFMAHLAVSPREVVDVLSDGALVLGAASMGALRAADCWPAGAVGIGVVYRLFRSGVLDSDEEVAVAVRADGSDRAASLALVNVRHALSHSVRKGVLDRAEAGRVLSAASEMYYPERTWDAVLRRAGIERPEVRAFCTSLDLKRSDAQRALARTRRLLADDDRLAQRHRRRADAPFSRSELARERGYDVRGGVAPERLPDELLAWLIGSGRLFRHAPAAVAPVSAQPVWDALCAAGELDAELMRLHALRAAVVESERKRLAVRSRDVRSARREIAQNHGFSSWEQLLASAQGQRFGEQIRAAEEMLARAKRVRDQWFNPLLRPN